MYSDMNVYWVYFVTGLKLVQQQHSTAILAKAKEDIMKKSSYCHPFGAYTFNLKTP
jgi:hypothetical protein